MRHMFRWFGEAISFRGQEFTDRKGNTFRVTSISIAFSMPVRVELLSLVDANDPVYWDVNNREIRAGMEYWLLLNEQESERAYEDPSNPAFENIVFAKHLTPVNPNLQNLWVEFIQGCEIKQRELTCK